MLEEGDDSDYPALLRCRGTVTGRTLIGSYAGATFGLRLIAVEHSRRGEACGQPVRRVPRHCCSGVVLVCTLWYYTTRTYTLGTYSGRKTLQV